MKRAISAGPQGPLAQLVRDHVDRGPEVGDERLAKATESLLGLLAEIPSMQAWVDERGARADLQRLRQCAPREMRGFAVQWMRQLLTSSAAIGRPLPAPAWSRR